MTRPRAEASCSHEVETTRPCRRYPPNHPGYPAHRAQRPSMNAMPHIGVIGGSIGGAHRGARAARSGLRGRRVRAFGDRAGGARSRHRAASDDHPRAQARYAGYVAWRATVPESELTPASFEALRDSIAYCLLPAGHILVYPIPSLDGDLEPGRRLANLVWYHNYEAGAGSPATRRSASACTGRDGNRADAGLHPPYGFPNVAIRSIRHSNSTRFSSIAGSRNP